jgi:glycosyltransferase involved in cell wall biosynthesis
MSGPPGSPTVSVLLRTYNHEPFIAQAIESVLIQEAGFPFELVIGEDCSTDATRAVVEGYAAAHPDRIRTILPRRNVGHGEIFRSLMTAATGDFIAYLDGDDYWTSRSKLARQVEFLERHPRCASCFHDVSLVYDEAGLPSGTVSPRFAEQWFGLDQILMECFVPAPSMMFRRNLIDELLPWMYESAWIDWLIHIKAAERGQLGCIREALAAYRVHKGGMFSSLDRVSQLEEDLRFYGKLLPEFPEKRLLIERCLAFRGAQIAIERLGVPLDACVVLVDPRREFRPYFNGRHARNLPRREGREVTELEAIRAAAVDLPEAVGDYGSPLPVSRGMPGCFVVVPRGSANWLRERPNLSSYLRQRGELAWEDAWVDVHELPAPPEDGVPDGSRGACRVEVDLLRGGGAIPTAHLDAPASGALLPAHAVTVAGWAVGERGAPVSVDFEAGGEMIWRAPVLRERPDVEKAFPELPVSRPGFQTTLNTLDAPAGAVTLVAVFVDGTRLPFAELRFRPPGEEEVQGPSVDKASTAYP